MKPRIPTPGITCDKCGKETVEVVTVSPEPKVATVRMSEWPNTMTLNAIYHVITYRLTCLACGHSIETSR